MTFGGKSHQNRWGHCKSKRLEPPHPRCRLHRAGIGVLLCFCGATALCEAPCALCRRGNRVNKSLRRNGYGPYQVPLNMCLSLHSPAAEGAKTNRAAGIYTKGTRDEACGRRNASPTTTEYVYTVGERLPLPPYLICRTMCDTLIIHHSLFIIHCLHLIHRYAVPLPLIGEGLRGLTGGRGGLAAARSRRGSDNPLPTKPLLCGDPYQFVFTVGHSPPSTLRRTRVAWGVIHCARAASLPAPTGGRRSEC